jgi:DsbC/DsbD-like thiol-disulfide interchange protein
MKIAFVAAWLMLAHLPAQDLGSLDGPAKAPKQYVIFAAEPQSVAAGKQSLLELRFKVLDGYHINSHAPKSELQIPTVVQLSPGNGVKLAQAEYPAGKPYSFSFDPSEKLDVYQGDFVVRVPVIAAAGAHELKGQLTYQACDTAACYPPRTLPVDVLFTAK